MGRIDELLAELAAAPERDVLAETAVVHRAANLLRPPGALARLDRLAGWLAAWQRTDLPEVGRPGLVLVVGDHGSARRLDPGPVATDALVDAIRAGVSTSTVLAAELDASMRLVDARTGGPAGDVVEEDSSSVDEFEAAFEEGRQAVESMDVDLLLVGAAGAGTGFGAAMAAAAMDGGDPASWLVTDEPDPDRTDVVERSVRRIRDAGPVSPLDAVRRLGGREMAVLAGMIVEARLRSLPTVIDGCEALVVAAAIDGTRPGSLGHVVLAAPVSPEGAAAMARRLDLEPVLDLHTGMGEGVGALLALPLVRMAARVVVDVTTGDEWGVH